MVSAEVSLAHPHEEDDRRCWGSSVDASPSAGDRASHGKVAETMWEGDPNEPVKFEIVKMRRCAQCRGPVIYCGCDVPDDDIRSYCSGECEAMHEQEDAALWVDAIELAPKRILDGRPDSWRDQ